MPSYSSRRYIVVFHDDISGSIIAEREREIEAHGGVITNRYDHEFLNGFAAVIPDAYLAQFQTDFQSQVKYIEEDSIVTTQ